MFVPSSSPVKPYTRNRAGNSRVYDGADGDRATLDVIRNLLLSTGSAELTCGKRAFVNFTRNLILGEVPYYLPPEISVIEILEDTEVDAELVRACRRLKDAGYLLALDDFVLKGNACHPLLNLADFVKVDLLSAGRGEAAAVRKHCGHLQYLLAEKVETREAFEESAACGYAFFQGYFFSVPELISRTSIPAHKLSYLRLIREIYTEPFEFANVERVIKVDTALVVKLLRYMNSAFFALSREVTSIRHALVLLGEREIRKWVSLVALTELAADQSDETLRLSLVRAAFCESLASDAGLGTHSSELFLLGMLSLIDVFVGRPMAEVAEFIPLASELKAALLGQANPYRQVLDVVVNYERARWDAAALAAAEMGVSAEALGARYMTALLWAEKALDLRQVETV